MSRYRDRDWGDRYVRGYDRGYEDEARYGDPSRRGYGRHDHGSNYASGFDWGYAGGAPGGSRRRDYGDYDRDDREFRMRGRGRDEDRDWLDRASDEVASWFGDEEAERRRRRDEMRDRSYYGEGSQRGRGPKGYRRSDERIREDVSDRLSDDYYLDASDIEVSVENGEVTLSGTVDSRAAKRYAEDCVESVSGVMNVENRIRVRQGSQGTAATTGTTGTAGATGATETRTGSSTAAAAGAAGTGGSR